jgi:hypothetical protein
MTAEDRAGVYYFASRCLLRIFDAEAAQRLSIEVRGLSREDLAALIEGSTRDIPTAEHRRLLQEASDFVRWGGWWGRSSGGCPN